ncbi:TPA: hypothetical protein N0F65_008515 [Lagenidium giganteum]|uniref:Uncharacterized protein n=1 Tax=Lagenidium giganteum TaxID=4803 RepID=A0AAV2Z551_9STRA|nr:TPA: hypothetical protein N0F65_008515 [Lagenidium giganteum]
MSTQRGNVKRGPPKHQNTFAYKHNPKSKKTQKILAMPIFGLCTRCHDQIEWRKKYRKYKPLTKPATCNYCHQKTVTAAYHVACGSCAKERDICAKCCQSKEIVPSEQELAEEKKLQSKENEVELEGMRERERRAHLRKIERERRAAKEAEAGEGGDSDGMESFDEEDEDFMEE